MNNIDPEAIEAFSINEAYENAWQQALSDKIAQAVAGKFSTPVNQIPSDVLHHIKSQEQKIVELQQQLAQVSAKAETSYNYVTPRRVTQLELIKLYGHERLELNPTARTPIEDMKRDLLTYALQKKVDINWKEIPSLLKDGLGLNKKCFNGAYFYEGATLKQPGVSMFINSPRTPMNGAMSPPPVTNKLK